MIMSKSVAMPGSQVGRAWRLTVCRLAGGCAENWRLQHLGKVHCFQSRAAQFKAIGAVREFLDVPKISKHAAAVEVDPEFERVFKSGQLRRREFALFSQAVQSAIARACRNERNHGRSAIKGKLG